MDNYSQFSKHRMTIIIVLLIIIVIMFARGLRQILSILYGALVNIFHWCTTSKEQRALEKSVVIMKLQVELANLKAYKKCIEANTGSGSNAATGNRINTGTVKLL